MKKLCSVLICIALAFAVCLAEDDRANLDYSDATNWSYWAEETTHPADLFIVCPTVDMGKSGNLLADAGSESYRSSFTGALNMELGIYDDVCDIYAPFYQQVTFPAYSLSDEESEEYFAFAYEDVRSAFIYYLENTDPTRPIVLAGFSQGADMAIRLAEEFFADEDMAARLVAVYAIGWRLTEEDAARAPWLKPAQGKTDLGVIVAFNSEAEFVTDSVMVPEGTHTYSINPLNWMTDSEMADASLNEGACFTDYGGNIKTEIPELCGAYIDENRGVLKVVGVTAEEYPGRIFPDGIYHLYDYQFFFRNLEENVIKRVETFINK